ncbi:MAG: hypothetical protein OEU26_12530 [Candidatus Tectomicrobia bacterium]|nr:hypothetical protein [Candidatus Tectomicrobia bacterium]
MAQKKQALDTKLGSWTDQANLTRTPTSGAEPRPTTPPAKAKREAYPVERSLMERLADTAEHYGMTRHELLGYLLTWSLDQLDTGAHTIPPER